MEYKILEEKDLELMLDFVDDENTKYSIVDLKEFIDGKIILDLLQKQIIRL